jgi:hypothetical protein
LHLELDFVFRAPGGEEIPTVARIANLGARNGMLIFEKYEDVCQHSEAVQDAGYGYSVIDEPRPDEEFDLGSFQAVFRDWGWSGQLGDKPPWMR